MFHRFHPRSCELWISAGKTICSCLSIQEHHSFAEDTEETEETEETVMAHHGSTTPICHIHQGLHRLMKIQLSFDIMLFFASLLNWLSIPYHFTGRSLCYCWHVCKRWNASQRSCIFSSVMNFSSNLRLEKQAEVPFPAASSKRLAEHRKWACDFRLLQICSQANLAMLIDRKSPKLQLERLVVQPFKLPPDKTPWDILVVLGDSCAVKERVFRVPSESWFPQRPHNWVATWSGITAPIRPIYMWYDWYVCDIMDQLWTSCVRCIIVPPLLPPYPFQGG